MNEATLPEKGCPSPAVTGARLTVKAASATFALAESDATWPLLSFTVIVKL
jgi:hypothetical protein